MMSSTLLISLFVFSMLGVGGLAIYVALYGSHRVLEERFADLAIKMRASQGAFDDDRPQDEGLGRMLFRWASARVPAPNLDTPSGEKLSDTLVQAGFINSGAAHAFQVFRVMAAVAVAL